MNKKTLITLLAAVAVLVAAIAVAIFFLYSETGRKPGGNSARFQETHPLVAAVPSDAALVFCVKDFGTAEAYLTDTAAIFGQLMSGKLNGLFRSSYPSLRKAGTILSLHYSKDFAPLLVISTGTVPLDTTEDVRKLLAAADTCGLHAKIRDGDILISTSETIINSSLRHLSGGLSVMNADGFSELASEMNGSDILFISNAYSDILIRTFCNARLFKHSTFFERLAKWSAFSITAHAGNGIAMSGSVLDDEDPSYYLNLLRKAGSGTIGVAEILPAEVDFVASLPIKNIAAYIEGHRNYLDARSSLEKYKAALDAQKKDAGSNAEEWARQLDIQEIAVADLHVGNALRRILLIKPGNKPAMPEGIQEYSWKNFAKTLFGGIFSAESEDTCAWAGGWILAGSKSVVEECMSSESRHETLKERLARAGLQSRIPNRNCGFFLYHALSEDPATIDKSFAPELAKAFRKTLAGVTFVPTTLSVLFEGETTSVRFNYDRVNVSRSRAPAVDRDTIVNVPKGPFPVKNSATGKTNTFYQNTHKSICLQDEKGKDLWGIPFQEDLCGYVEEVDFFNNGKIQYLFAAGSNLYLIDRLGRFVNGFPVNLGKEIALGPKVFDFTGAHGYSAMVLYKDNSVGLVNLHGKPKKDWKGITVKETVKTIPELLNVGKSRFWIVRTSMQTLLFPFNGGDPVVRGEGDKMIRPDSPITVNGSGSITAKCYDAKDRTYKIDK